MLVSGNSRFHQFHLVVSSGRLGIRFEVSSRALVMRHSSVMRPRQGTRPSLPAPQTRGIITIAIVSNTNRTPGPLKGVRSLIIESGIQDQRYPLWNAYDLNSDALLTIAKNPRSRKLDIDPPPKLWIVQNRVWTNVTVPPIIFLPHFSSVDVARSPKCLRRSQLDWRSNQLIAKTTSVSHVWTNHLSWASIEIRVIWDFNQFLL